MVNSNEENFRPFDDIWLWHDAYSLKEQGWKVHISCYDFNYDELFENVCCHLKNYTFKIACNRLITSQLNAGRFGNRIIGKIITVYINTVWDLICLIDEVYPLIKNIEGPIISDELCYKESVIYFRYSSFESKDLKSPVICKEQKNQDLKNLLKSCNSSNNNIRKYVNQVANVIGENITITKQLKTYPRIVYKIHIKGKPYVLKLIKSDNPFWLNKINNEIRIIKSFHKKILFPEISFFGRTGSISYIISEWIEGENISMLRKSVLKDKNFLKSLSNRLKTDLEYFIKKGVRPFDINLNNIIIKNNNIYFIDLDEFVFENTPDPIIIIEDIISKIIEPLRNGLASHLLFTSIENNQTIPNALFCEIFQVFERYFFEESSNVFKKCCELFFNEPINSNTSDSIDVDLLYFIVHYLQHKKSEQLNKIYCEKIESKINYYLSTIPKFETGGIYNSQIGLFIPIFHYCVYFKKQNILSQSINILINLYPTIKQSTDYSLHSGLSGIIYLYLSAKKITNDIRLDKIINDILQKIRTTIHSQMNDLLSIPFGVLHGWASMLDILLKYDAQFQSEFKMKNENIFIDTILKLMNNERFDNSWCNGSNGLAMCFSNNYLKSKMDFNIEYSRNLLLHSRNTIYSQIGICHGYASYYEALKELNNISDLIAVADLNEVKINLFVGYINMNNNFKQWENNHKHTLTLLNGKIGVLISILNAINNPKVFAASPYMHLSLL